MRKTDELINTLEILRDAVEAKDQRTALEAVSIFLLQLMEGFGHDTALFARTYPQLENLKTLVQSDQFEKAWLRTLALLAKFRAVPLRMHALADVPVRTQP